MICDTEKHFALRGVLGGQIPEFPKAQVVYFLEKRLLYP